MAQGKNKWQAVVKRAMVSYIGGNLLDEELEAFKNDYTPRN
jgi:hypothetical protein